MPADFTTKRIRLKIECSSSAAPLDVFTAATPFFWHGNDLQFELGFFMGGVLLDISPWDVVTLAVRRTDAEGTKVMEGTCDYADLNRALTSTEWLTKEADKAHAVIPFPKEETALSITSGSSERFFLVISIVTSAGAELTAQTGFILVRKDGAGSGDDSPLIGASIIPDGATYNGSGEYTLTVVADKVYRFGLGANDTSLENGAETYTSAVDFVADGTSVVLNGTPSALVTATVRTPAYYTAETCEALFERKRVLTDIEADIAALQSDVSDLQDGLDLAFTRYFEAASEAAMLLLGSASPVPAKIGDICKRTDLNRWFLLAGVNPATLGNWKIQPENFRWIEAGWLVDTTYSKGDALNHGASSYISQIDSNLGNSPSDPANVGSGQPWGLLASGGTPSLATATPEAVVISAPGAVGTSLKAAREDHKHPAPDPATRTVSGFMSATDKYRFDFSEIGIVNGSVRACAKSGDWFYIVGSFTTYDNVPAVGIAKIDSKGKMDPRFQTLAGFTDSMGGATYPDNVVVLPSGNVLVGKFQSKMKYRGDNLAFVHCLDEFGEPEPGFAPVTTIAATGSDNLLDMCYLPEDRIALLSWQTLRIVGLDGVTLSTVNGGTNMHAIESFGEYLFLAQRPTSDYNGTTNPKSTKRLDFSAGDTGTIETTWESGAGDGWNASANSVKLNAAGSVVYFAGQDANYGGTDSDFDGVAAVSKNIIALHASGGSIGQQISTFVAEIVTTTTSANVSIYGVDSQDRVYFGGPIATVNGTAVTANRLYRVDADGGNLKEFKGFNGDIYGCLVSEDDRILVFGNFTTYWALPVPFMVMIDDAGRRIFNLAFDDVSPASIHSSEEITISDNALKTIVMPADSLNHLAEITVDPLGYMVTPYTVNVVLDLTEPLAKDGDRITLHFDLPSTPGITVNIRNGTSGGTILATFETYFEGAATFMFQLLTSSPNRWVMIYPDMTASLNLSNEYMQGEETYGATISLDMDKESYRVLTLTGDCTLGTASASRATDGSRVKAVCLKVIASGATRTLSFASGIIEDPIAIPDGEFAVVSVSSWGSAEADTITAVLPKF